MAKFNTIRLVSLFIALCLIVGCCGCTTGIASARPVVAGKEGAQYVIALNPSIAFEDTTVNSIRNSLSSSLQADVSSGKAESLYSGTAWRWLTHNSDGSWDTRKLRAVTMWMNSEGLTNNGVPYTYTVTDSGLSSLSVYDATKMDIKGVSDGELPSSGVIMSFTGEKEEGITYIADKDCIVELADRSSGNIAVVSSISGLGTDFTALEGAKKAIVLRIYKNNRIYWQEVLEAGTTAVSFPTFNLELKTGDIISVTAQAMDDTSAIIRGNCDLPATTTTIIEKIPTETQVEDIKVTGIPFFNEDGLMQFTIVRNADATVNQVKIIKSLYDGMCKNLNTDVEYKKDGDEVEGRRIFIYDVNDPAAKAVMNEVKQGRKQNYADFIIRLVGDDIVIAAVSDMGLEMAIEFFLKNYCTSQDAQLPLDLDYVSSKYNPIKNVTLAGTAISKYRIVVSSTASYMESTAANALSEELTRLCGNLIPVVEDKNTSKQDYEIVIGNSNRANYRGIADYNITSIDSASLVDGKASNYEIKVDSKRTTVLADHVSGVNAGTLKLISLIKSKTSVAKSTVKGKYDGEYSLLDGYKLTFADEFDGDSLKKHWSRYGLGDGDAGVNWTGGKTYTNLPTVSGGNLVNTVTWKRNSDKSVDINKSEMRSMGKNAMNYMWGYIEIRIKYAKSWGLTHSFLTQAENTGGFLEANIIETFGNPYKNQFNMHSWGGNVPGGHINHHSEGTGILNNSVGVTCEEGFGQEYHTFGWEWTDDWSQFYCDGKKTWYFEHSTPSYSLFDKPCFVVLSFRSGFYKGPNAGVGYGGENTKNNPFFMDETMDFYSDTVLVDYLHIYQKDNGSVMYIKQ